MMGTFREDLEKNLKDPEFVKQFGAAQAKSSFALTLARARIKLGLTQKGLASKTGVSQGYIAKLEGGEANPTLDRIGSLLAVLGLSLVTNTTTLSPYPESSPYSEPSSFLTIWSIHTDVRTAEINYERGFRSRAEDRELEQLPYNIEVAGKL